MTPEARLAASIEVLDSWCAGQPVEQALTRWARGARYAGSKDRAAVRDHVFDVLRSKGRCEALGGGVTGRALVLGLLRLQQVDPAQVFTGTGHAPSPLSPAEQNQTPAEADPWLDIPDGCRAPLLDAFEANGADPVAVLSSLQARAPLWLRVNRRKATRSEAAAALAAEGIETAVDDRVPGALRVVTHPRRVTGSGAYRKGWIEPQDLSVQAALDHVAWPETGRILDYCAGGGGKALAVADRSAATILAHDISPRRMTDLPARAGRAGVHIETVSTDALRHQRPFDLVLCDVPCSGSGTWRRDPEAKWRLTPDRLHAVLREQDAILDAAADLVGPEGQLVYMTCSLFAAENADRVAAFVARHPEWRLVGSVSFGPPAWSDGFFCARMQRADCA